MRGRHTVSGSHVRAFQSNCKQDHRQNDCSESGMIHGAEEEADEAKVNPRRSRMDSIIANLFQQQRPTFLLL